MNGFLKKTNYVPKRSAKRVIYNRFYPACTVEKGAGALVATENKNCDFFGGKLRCCIGATRYKLKNEALDIPLFPAEYGDAKDLFAFEFTYNGDVKDSVGVVMGNNRFYIYDELTGQPALKLVATGINFQKSVRVFNKDGDETLLLCYNDKIYTYNPLNASKSLWMEQTVTDACFFNERLFICDKKILKYSAPMEYKELSASIDDGGEIKFASEKGDAVAFAVVGENAYLFFEKGVVKLDLDGAGRDFVVTSLPYSGGKIVKGSVCVCGEKVCFLAVDGAYVFDGNGFERLGRGWELDFNGKTSYCRAGYGFGRYYLTFTKSNGTRKTVFFDLTDKNNFGEVFAMSGLGNCNGNTVCVKDGYFSRLDEDGVLPLGEKYYFKVENTDFSVSGEKFLRAIELCGRGNCKLTVKGRNGVKSWVVALNGREKRLVGVKGALFTLEIEPYKECVIDELGVDLERLGG